MAYGDGWTSEVCYGGEWPAPQHEGPACECCGKPADGYSLDEIPLCDRCAGALVADDEITACGRETDHAQVEGTSLCRCGHAMFC